MRKTLLRVLFAGIIAMSSAALAVAMSDHGLTGGESGGYATCMAWMDAMDPELQNPEHVAYVYLYGPSNEFLGARGEGELGGDFIVTIGHTSVGSGTYHCHAWFSETWDGGAESDSLDYYFEM